MSYSTTHNTDGVQVSSTSYTPLVMTSPTSTSTSDQIYTIETINPSSSTPGIAASSDVVAILPLSGTTVTAYQVTGTTGLAVVDSTTLSFRQQGITLSNGDVVSLGYNGLVESTTTALYMTDTSLFASTAVTTSATGASGVTSESSQTANSGSTARSTTSSGTTQLATSATASTSSTTSASGTQGRHGLGTGGTLLLLGAVLSTMGCCA